MFELEKLTKRKILAQAVAVALGLTPFLSGCSGGSGGGNNSATISAVGGSTTGMLSGGGGRVQLVTAVTTAEILRSGRASAQVDVTEPTMAFGNNKLTVSSNGTVVAASDTQGEYAYYVVANELRSASGVAPTGTLYLYNGTIRQYAGNTSTDAAFTGIEVAKGVTLTISNSDENGNNGDRIFLANDIYNQGTITVADREPGYRASLALSANNYFGAKGSVVTTAGRAGAENGGVIDMVLAGGFYNGGALDSSAAATVAEGAVGGSIVIVANTAAANSGNINLSGGSGYGGGPAGVLAFYGADVLNSGTITGTGGTGTHGGGEGAEVLFIASCDSSDGYGGDAYNEGALHLEGGNASVMGRAGAGGSLDLCSKGGTLVMNADADLSGGSTASDSASSYGGRGGAISLYGGEDTSALAGDLLVSGNLNLDGGAGGIAAGVAGYFSAVQMAYGGDARLALLGYTAIDVSGGDAQRAYGGGSVGIDAHDGTARNQADIRAHSGDATANPGPGGYFSASGANIENSGEIDVSGDALGAGGSILMIAYEGNVTNTGALRASGGAGTAAGGDGGHITLNIAGSGAVSSSGGSYADGGNATGETGVGGDGGTITYSSNVGEGFATTFSGTLSVSGGSGTTAGATGCALVDGQTISGTCP